MDLTTLYWILIAVMVVAAFGAILPGFPSASLILLSILVWGIATKFAGIGWALVVVFVVLIVSAAIEPLATYWGAQRVGASKWSQIGAIAGMVLGFLGLLPILPIGGPILGLLVGPIIGAFVGEFLYRRDRALKDRTELALKVGLSVAVGSLLGNLIETVLAFVAVIIFAVTTWPQVYGF